MPIQNSGSRRNLLQPQASQAAACAAPVLFAVEMLVSLSSSVMSAPQGEERGVGSKTGNEGGKGFAVSSDSSPLTPNSSRLLESLNHPRRYHDIGFEIAAPELAAALVIDQVIGLSLRRGHLNHVELAAQPVFRVEL